MEMVVIDGIERGQWMEVELKTYQEMKQRYIEMISEFLIDGFDWDYETRFFFELWLYEELNGIEHLS
ncbi:MAG: hypothetical protein C0473_04025 [Cyanobacteria bacterium DS3.002]|nr:hypothetical protein [Cyanobacteria bacterium DS3.002]MBA4050057.1 hypothetical protein [Cyanobacteria bacterium DS2.008]